MGPEGPDPPGDNCGSGAQGSQRGQVVPWGQRGPGGPEDPGVPWGRSRGPGSQGSGSGAQVSSFRLPAIQLVVLRSCSSFN